MSRKAYPTDLSDSEWLLLEALLLALLPQSKRGKKRVVELRAIVNAIFYVLRSGCAWRMLPHDFPAWQTVYGYFRRWRQSGVWEQLNDALVETVRIEAGRAADPTVAIIDSQSAKTTAVAGERGFDGAKRVTGRKRHILVDTMGLLLAVVVHKASISERAGAKTLLQRAKQKGLHALLLIWADGGYSGQPMVKWVAALTGWIFEVIKRSDDVKGFQLLPRRWVVAPSGPPTFAWLGNYRRLSKDYEVLPETSEAFIYAAMVNLMLRRLARNPAIYC